MRALAGGLLLAVFCSVTLAGQERDRALERIALGLQQPPSPPSLLRSLDPVEAAPRTTFGVFTLVPPTTRGEMIRVSVPIGALVTRAFKAAAAANRRRREAAARSAVAADLAWFYEQQARSRAPGSDRR